MTAAEPLTPPAAVSAEPIRWPLQPLLDITGLTRTALAAHLGTTLTTLRVVDAAGLTDQQADQWAVRLGQHPASVWGLDWYEAATDIERLTADRPVAARIAAALRARIARDELRPGDPVPTMRELGAAWGVNKGVAGKALTSLARDGVIVTAGRRRVVAGDAAAPVDCSACGAPVEPDAEHYPHEPDCPAGSVGWCTCHRPVHPACCASCASGVA